MFGLQKELEGLAKPLLESVPGGGSDSAPQSEYIGGDFRCACCSTPLFPMPFHAFFFSLVQPLQMRQPANLHFDRTEASLLSLPTRGT